jgi:hypothetical protein
MLCLYLQGAVQCSTTSRWKVACRPVVVNAIILPQMMRIASAMQSYFVMINEGVKPEPADSSANAVASDVRDVSHTPTRRIGPSDCKAPCRSGYSEEDGRVVGHLLMDVVEHSRNAYLARPSKSRTADEVHKFVMCTAMLHDAAFGNLCSMLEAMVANQFHIFEEVGVHDPAGLTKAQAAAIGRSCKAVRLRHLRQQLAVADLLHNYPALRAFSNNNEWFRPMLATIMQRQAAASRLETGMMLLMMMGLSLFDVGSDLLSVGSNFMLGQTATALAIAGLVLFSQALQIVIVVVKNGHCGWRAVLKEIGIVLSFFKPAVDVARLLRGYEVNGAPFTTHTERSCCKVIETVVESIPTMLLLLSQNFNVTVWTWSSVLAIAMSWYATSSKAAMMAFDLDSSLEKRLGTPEFYGYAPSPPMKRKLALTLLILVGLAHIIGKSVAVALLFATEPLWVIGMLGADVGLMFLYKAIRCDVLVWIPGSGIGMAIVYRIVGTLMATFTAFVHLRHPLELGGLWWLLSMVLNQLECFLAGWLYSQYYTGPGKFETGVLYAVLGSLAALWAVAFVGFLLSIERTHLRTFVSLETGAQFVQRVFTENEGNDALRRYGCTHIVACCMVGPGFHPSRRRCAEP